MTEKTPEKVQYVFTQDYSNVLVADITVISILVLLCIFWKEQRILLLVGTLLYSFFTLLWHY